ncbi:MAG: hypothetical protein WAN75_07500 [Xanthobacteraceae bacterium]
MLQRKNATTRAFFSAAALPAQREAVQAAETNTICKVTVPSPH